MPSKGKTEVRPGGEMAGSLGPPGPPNEVAQSFQTPAVTGTWVAPY